MKGGSTCIKRMLQMRSWLSVYLTDAGSKEGTDIPIAPSLYNLSNKMGNSLLAVRKINHKYIVVGRNCKNSAFKIESSMGTQALFRIKALEFTREDFYRMYEENMDLNARVPETYSM